MTSFSCWEMASVSSQGTVSSATKMFFVLLDRRTTSSQSDVCCHLFWKDKSLLELHPNLPVRSSIQNAKQVLGYCSCLRSLVSFPFEIDRFRWRCLAFVGFDPLQVVHVVISVRILSCLNQYWPSSSALNHILTRYPRIQRVAPHCLQDGSSS